MTQRESIDALFLSYFEDIDRWHNDHAPSASGPTGSPVELLAPGDPGGGTILARTGRQGVSLDGALHDLPRFMSYAGYGSTIEYRRFDAFSLTHLSGKYYESLGQRSGYDVRHLNHVSRVDIEQLGRVFAPRYVMLSSTFMTEVANIMDAMQHIRRAWPGVPVVVGGLFLVEVEKALTPANFQRLLTSFGADVYVVSPLGEAAFLKLLEHVGGDFTELELPGSFVKNGRRYEKCEALEPGLPIDDHWVRWDQLDPAGLYHTVHTRTARSCAFICSFCSYPANQGPLTLAQPETLRAELESMVRSGVVRSIVFTDDTFNVPAPRFKELCRVLADFDFDWYSYFRCQFADEDTVKLMVDSGCKGAFLGFESLDDQVLKNMKKAATLKAYTRGTRMLKKHGIPCHANFIIGFPGDKPENTPKFIDFVDDEGIEFYYATPWFCSPATPIAQEKDKYGVVGDYYRWTHDTMTAEEAMELEAWTIQRAKESVWITELGARNFWTELFLYSNGMSVAEAQRLVRCFNKYVGKDTPKSVVEGDPEFRWLRDTLRAREFPSPPGVEHYRHAPDPARRRLMDPCVEAEVLAAMSAQRKEVLRPPAELASQVSAQDYVDGDVYARELERVFRDAWIPVARERDLERPGDFVTTELAGDALAVTRGEDGEVHAFHNVCLHRGAIVLREQRGAATRLRCPYHGFTYDASGVLRSLPQPESFDHACAGDALPRVRSVAWRGWVWVNLGEGLHANDIGEDLADELSLWPFEELEVKDRRTVDVEFGWKVGVEAFLEPFHVPEIHGRTAHPLVDYRGMAVRTLGDHSRMALPFRTANAYSADGVFGEAAARAGIELFPELNEAQRSAHFVYLVFPSTILMLLPNHMLFLSFLPLAVDRCRMRYELLAMPAESDAARAWYESLKTGYDRLLEEDLDNLPWIQKGVADSTFERASISGYEQRILHFRAALDRRLKD